MKRKKRKTVFVIPMSLDYRLALWVSLDLIYFLLRPKEFAIDRNLVLLMSGKLEKHDGVESLIDIEFSERQLYTSYAVLQCACLYLDGIYKHFDTPIMERLDAELKKHEAIIRNLKNTFSQIISDNQE